MSLLLAQQSVDPVLDLIIVLALLLSAVFIFGGMLALLMYWGSDHVPDLDEPRRGPQSWLQPRARRMERRDASLQQIASDEKTRRIWTTSDVHMLSFPAFNDHSRPEVQALNEAWKRADTARSDMASAGWKNTGVAVNRLSWAAADFHTALGAATDMARAEGWGRISADDQRELDRAKRLLSTIRDTASSATEREVAVQSTLRVVTDLKQKYHQVIDLEAFRQAIETRAGLRATEP